MATGAKAKRIALCVAATVIGGGVAAQFVSTAAAGEAGPAPAVPKDVYGNFNRFCIEHFGAEKEPLVYETFGKELKCLPEGSWVHASETSAAVAFETNLPAKAHVEYGETKAYGRRTAEHERPFYLHLHYLKDLKPGTTYHYRLVAADERGNRTASADATLRTKAPPGAIHVPDDLKGPPYALDKAGATYVVTKDLTIDGKAFEVAADNVTLDLGGHTVTYNNKAKTMPPKANSVVWLNESSHGVLCKARKDTRILNGRIKQGAGDNGARSYSIGFNRSTNSFGIATSYNGRNIHHNRLFGTGFHVMAIAWGSRDTVSHNLIHLEGRKPVVAKSYGEQAKRCNLVALRLTQYDNAKRVMENNVYDHNVVVIRVRKGSAGTGTWLCSDPYVQGLVLRDNIVKVVAADRSPITTKYKTVACITAQGDHHKHTEDRPPVVYEGNTFISNIGHVAFGDSYGVGSNHRFYHCKFVKVGNDPRYKTVRIGFWNRRTTGHVFRDCTFEGGADLDSVAFEGTGERDFTVEWTLTVKAAPGAKVAITDKTGKVVHAGRTDGKGRAAVPLAQYTRRPTGKTFFTPHAVTVGGATKTITMDRRRTYEVKGGTWTEPPERASD